MINLDFCNTLDELDYAKKVEKRLWKLYWFLWIIAAFIPLAFGLFVLKGLFGLYFLSVPLYIVTGVYIGDGNHQNYIKRSVGNYILHKKLLDQAIGIDQ